MFFCELHNCEECEIDEEGFGSCGDYNADGSCLWCLQEEVLEVIHD
jgi:hypothetical protein